MSGPVPASVIGIALALATAVAGYAILPGELRGKAGAWLGLLLVGAAATLQLVRAGPMVGYQHLAPPWAGGIGGWVAAAVLVLQLGLVLGLGRRAIGEAWAALRLVSSPTALVLALGVFALTAATLSRDPVYFGLELAAGTIIQTLHLATLVVAMAAVSPEARERLRGRLDRWLGDRDGGDRFDRFPIVGAVWVFALSAGLAVFPYELHPHVPDEVVYLLHARYLAAGHLWMAVPPVPDAFTLNLMMTEGAKWFSPVPPAWPFLLSLGVRAGATWLVNPILAGVSVLLAHRLLSGIYDRRVARIGTVLLCTSPWLIFLGMSLMTHAFALAATLLGAVCVLRLREGGSLAWAAPGGLGIALVALNRPLEGLTVAVLLGLWSLGGVRSLAGRVAGAALLAGSTVAVTAAMLPYNRLFTGNPFYFPINAYLDGVYGPGRNSLGFGANRGLGWPGLDPLPGHGPADVLINADLNAYAVNVELFGWPIGSLLPILLLFAARTRTRADWWMAAAAGAIIGVHSFYWFSGGPDFGARYWFLILIPCVALAARGIDGSGDRKPTRTGVRVVVASLALCVISVATFLPWRAVDKYHGYRGMRPGLRDLAGASPADMYLIRGSNHPDYASAAIENPIDLTTPAPLFVWDGGTGVRGELVRAYPERRFWIIDGPTRTGAGYEIVAGPLTATELVERGAR